MFAILMALPLLHVKQTAPATHPCSRRPTRTGLSNGRLPCSTRPPAIKLYDEKCSRNLVASKAALLEGRPALGIVLLTDSTVLIQPERAVEEPSSYMRPKSS